MLLGRAYGVRPRPRRQCVRWGPSSPPPKKSGTAAPTFRPMSIVAKQLDGPPVGTEIGLGTGDIVWGSSISEMTYFVSTQSVYTLYYISPINPIPFLSYQLGLEERCKIFTRVRRSPAANIAFMLEINQKFDFNERLLCPISFALPPP